MSNEDGPFDSPRLLLAGADRHIDAFGARMHELQALDWATPIAGTAPGEVFLQPKITVPADMKQIVFDVSNNLRSALDHAVFASTVVLTGEERDGTKFPFGDTAAELQGDAKRRCRNVPREVLAFLLAFEAHRDGNPLLWGLNKLRNARSHRVLLPVAAGTRLSGTGEPTPGASVTHEWDPATGRFKAMLELGPDTPAGAVTFSFRLELLIGTGTFRGEPALGLFDRLRSEVERVVSGIEVETARILRERGS